MRRALSLLSLFLLTACGATPLPMDTDLSGRPVDGTVQVDADGHRHTVAVRLKGLPEPHRLLDEVNDWRAVRYVLWARPVGRSPVSLGPMRYRDLGRLATHTAALVGAPAEVFVTAERHADTREPRGPLVAGRIMQRDGRSYVKTQPTAQLGRRPGSTVDGLAAVSER